MACFAANSTRLLYTSDMRESKLQILRPLMNSVGVPVTSTDFAERHRGIDVSLGLWLGGAGRDVGALDSRSVGDRGEFLVGVLGGDVGLRLVGLGDEFPESIVGSAAHAVGISRALCRPIVHLEGKILEHEAGIRLRRHQSFDSGLRRFAGGTLQVAELDDRNRRVLGTALGAGDSLVQQLFRRIKRPGAERNDVADQSVLRRRERHRNESTAGPAG